MNSICIRPNKPLEFGIILFCLLGFHSFFSFAGVNPTRSPLVYTSAIGPSTTIEDYIPALCPSWDANVVSVRHIDDYIKILLEYPEVEQYSDSFTIKLVADLTYVTSESSGSTIGPTQITLYLHYDPSKDSVTGNFSYYRFTNAKSILLENIHIDVQNSSIAGTSEEDDIKEHCLVYEEIYAGIEYEFDCSEIPPLYDTTQVVVGVNGSPYDESTQLKLIRWPSIAGADEYDIEYTFWDYNSAAMQYLRSHTSTHYNFNTLFDKNATRVSVQGNSFTIPYHLYSKGYTFFRMRGVHFKDGIRQTTKWSSDIDAGDYPTMNSCTYWWIFYGLNPKLNWSWSNTFAEEGKMIPSVTYYDGTLRERQSVIFSKVDSASLISETIYDYQGRPAIKTLPVPTFDHFWYHHAAFNRNTNGNEYNRSNFDSLGCGYGPQLMDSTYGSSKYYSGSNPHAEDYPYSFIPSAKGFPFVQTEWTQDNTGRVARQSGAGNDFRLGGGHETKYYYAKPLQEELDMIFGTEVGFHSHYLKNMVVDPNGQVSISYLDAHGRTIATSLAGETPLTLDSLPSMQRFPGIYNMIPDTQSVNSEEHTIHLDNTFTNEAVGNVSLSYSLDPKSFLPECKDSGICYQCIYDLLVQVTDDCNNEKLPLSEAVIHQQYNYDLNDTPLYSFTFDTLCSNPAIGLTDSISLPDLPIGAYSVSKTLTLNPVAIEYYARHYVANNTCIKNFQEFYDSAIAHTDFSGCNITCASCMDNIGTREEFIQNHFSANYDTSYIPIHEDTVNAGYAYDDAVRQCNALCNTKNECEQLLDQLKADVRPGGQYGGYQKDNDGNYILDSTLTYFGSSGSYNILPGYSTLTYLDENGSSITVIDSLGNTVYPNELTLSSFIRQFDDSWLNALVTLHPEYPYYVWMKTHEASYDYDMHIRNTTSFAAARDSGFLCPISDLMSDVDYPFVHTDPFFTIDSIGEPFRDDMMADCRDYGGSGYSIWELTYRLVHCPEDITDCAVDTLGISGCAGDPEREWQIFSNLYLSRKAYYVDLMRNSDALTGGYNNYFIGWPHRFPESGSTFGCSAYISLPSLCTIGLVVYNGYMSRVKRVNRYTVPASKTGPEWIAFAQGSLLSQVAINCTGEGEDWLRRISNCTGGLDEVQTNYLKRMLTKVCIAGGDADHIFGSTTLPPGAPGVPDSLSPLIKYYNFQDVFAHLLGWSNSVNDSACNVLLIEFPGTWQNPYKLTNDGTDSKPPTCSCDRIAAMETEYDNFVTDNPDVGADTSFAAYLRNHYDTDISDTALFILQAECNDTWACVNNNFVIEIPPVLMCNQCLKCDTISKLTLNFYADYPVFAAHPNSTKHIPFYVNYMNTHLGYSLQLSDYKDFLYKCSGDSAMIDSVFSYGLNVTKWCRQQQDTFCNVIRQKVKAFNLTHSLIGTDYIDSVTCMLNTHFGLSLRLSDYYRHVVHCFDSDILDTLNWTGLENTAITCDQLGLLVHNLRSIIADTLDVAGFPCLVTRYLNSVLHKTYDFEDYWGMVAACTDSIAALALLGPDTATCFDTSAYGLIQICDSCIRGCDSCLAFRTVVSDFNSSNSLDPADNGYPLLVTGYLNGHFNTVLPYRSYHTIGLFTMGRRLADSLMGKRDNYPNDFTSDSCNWYIKYTNYRLYNLASPDTLSQLCNKPWFEVKYEPADTSDDCRQFLLNAAFENASRQYRNYLDSMTNDFMRCYTDSCMKVKEQMSLYKNFSQYHFTLYYYDQAGNLVMTVPPAGVDTILSKSVYHDIDSLRKRSDTASIVPEHTMQNRYGFNSLNQPVRQQTPDGGAAKFWYDELGRLILSQNAKQADLGSNTTPRYSYTLYDPLGRITEAGEISTNAGTDSLLTTYAPFNFHKTDSTFYIFFIPGGIWFLYDIIRNEIVSSVEFNGSAIVPDDQRLAPIYLKFQRWLGTGTRTQVTHTYYDAGLINDMRSFGAEGQTNLRSRVTASTYEDYYDDDSLTYDHGTFYSYDIEGNVKTLIQNNKALSAIQQDFKRIDYDYDLHSGKVNWVYYQRDSIDPFFHHYTYDENNRLVTVETGTDAHQMIEDATYRYYLHGPLCRLELGEKTVQGIDYAYTINGWLKMINGTYSVNADYDIGGDQDNQGDGIHGPNEIIVQAAKDQYGVTLNYYSGDYTPIGTGTSGFHNAEMDYSSSQWNTNAKNLYNGNIRAMTVELSKMDTGKPVSYGYHYDQLNRIKSMDMYKGYSSLAWASTAPLDDYKERYSYDANGNILTLYRNGYTANAGGIKMDSLVYKYTDGTNRLDHVEDPIDSTAYNVDIDSQDSANYEYDKTGNLVKDRKEGLDSIEWTVYGKVKKITKANGDSIMFAYDAMGNRISKKVQKGDTITCTYYIRDAQGNILATYNKDEENNMKLDEAMMYGSSRLGAYTYGKYVHYASIPGIEPFVEWNPDTIDDTLRQSGFGRIYNGKKSYELTNHLGNVLATVGDRIQTAHIGLNNYKIAFEKTQNDYYSFGMLMPNRSWSSNTGYRFGFNGKEKDDGVKGNGDSYDFGARMYDSKLGRWLAVDPLVGKYSGISSYNFAFNTPIQAIDPDGRLVIFVNGFVLDQWASQDNRKTINYRYRMDPGVDYPVPNNNYRPYPTYEVSPIGPTYLSKQFSYWGGIDRMFNDRFGDYNNLYINGSDNRTSSAKERYEAGMQSGYELIKKIQSGEIKLEKDETIKIVSHSQGTAHAAGMAFVLHNAFGNGIIKNDVEQIYYLAPQEPTEFETWPSIFSVQYSRESDKVASRGIISTKVVSGGSSFGSITGITQFVKLPDMSENRGGHNVETYSSIFDIPQNTNGAVRKNIGSLKKVN